MPERANFNIRRQMSCIIEEACCLTLANIITLYGIAAYIAEEFIVTREKIL